MVNNAVRIVGNFNPYENTIGLKPKRIEPYRVLRGV